MFGDLSAWSTKEENHISRDYRRPFRTDFVVFSGQIEKTSGVFSAWDR